MKQVIVTGANGFIGTNLLKLLSGKGIEVIAVVRNTSSLINSIKNLPHVKIVYCDMDDLSELSNLIPYGEADTFFHLAWSGSAGGMRGDYKRQLRNVQWTIEAVKAAHILHCRKFVGIGSAIEKDVNAYLPLDGSSPDLVSYYGIAKIMAHYMSKVECNRYSEMIHCWAQLAHIYGIGDYTSNFINYAIKCMLTKKEAHFTDGKQWIDFLSVENVAWGLYCIGQYGTANTTYYVGSNHPRPLKEYIQIIRDTIDPNIRLNLGAVPFHGVIHPAEVFDCSKLMEDTGYKPQESFEEGMQKVIPWVREQIQMGNL